jgi:hypothetical protein
VALRRGVLFAVAWSGFGQLWSRQHQERGIGILLEGAEVGLMLPEQRFNLVCGTVAPAYPDHLRWVAAQKAQLVKVGIVDAIVKPCAAAYCQTASSSARPSPTLRTWLLFGNISARERTSRCDRFWSNSRFTLAVSQGVVALDPLQRPNRRGYPHG